MVELFKQKGIKAIYGKRLRLRLLVHPGIRHLLISGLVVTQSPLKSCMACPDRVIFKSSGFSRHVNKGGQELNSPVGVEHIFG